ncbi:unnamed protein product [Polarella glacialis]|uniref:Uncharacterized protein n=1 Tax=Polarella glacialis TaxID=89957 RepID=A0A813IE62_POLGL|nr:unnamed protein product [Polarella glacialis]
MEKKLVPPLLVDGRQSLKQKGKCLFLDVELATGARGMHRTPQVGHTLEASLGTTNMALASRGGRNYKHGEDFAMSSRHSCSSRRRSCSHLQLRQPQRAHQPPLPVQNISA